MSILSAMNTGVSGLNAEGGALGVIGDNVANTNTVGFKESRAVFEDVLGGAVGQRDALGAGVHMARAQQIFAQGTLMNTGQPTDLALSGDGFFVVQGSMDGVTGNFFTRNGQTTLNAQGQLVNMDGLQLQGYVANPNGTFGPKMSGVTVPTGALAPKATSKISITAMLDSNAKTPVGAWDPLNPGTTSNYSTTVTAYDSLGNAHQVDVYFRNNGGGAWDYHAMVDGSNVTGGTPGTPVEIAGGTLTFTPTGALQSNTPTGAGTVDWANAQPGQPFTLDLGTPIANGGTGTDGTTQYAGPSNVLDQHGDGFGTGSLTGVSVDGNGVVSGTYSNGQKVPVAELAIAKFRSNDGLGRAGHNLWVASRESGDPAMGTSGSGGRGSITAGALEQSNVDIAQQFVDMIAHQRAFQANSKTITTADEMLQELVNLKR